MSKKTESKPEQGITIRLIPKEDGYIGYAAKDGVVLYEVTQPTLYHSVAGQLRQYLDMGLFK